MTLQFTFSCDGTLPSGMPCRGALPTRTTDRFIAKLVATESNWSVEYYGDFCPSCTRAKEASS